MNPTSATLIAVLLASLASLAGVALLLPILRKRHGLVMLLLALAAGTLLGDAFVHLLPEAIELHGGFTPLMGAMVLIGFLIFFAMEAFLNHHHDHGAALAGHDCDHDHDHEKKAFGTLNLVSDGFHNFLDGAVIATAFLVDIELGIATTIAVLMHELPQEIGDFAILLRSGRTVKQALGWNFAVSLTAFLGALTVLALPLEAELLEKYGLPLVAGAFVYIAASDLIPELHHHSRGRELLPIAGGLILGMAIMFALLGLEVDLGHDH